MGRPGIPLWSAAPAGTSPGRKAFSSGVCANSRRQAERNRVSGHAGGTGHTWGQRLRHKNERHRCSQAMRRQKMQNAVNGRRHRVHQKLLTGGPSDGSHSTQGRARRCEGARRPRADDERKRPTAEFLSSRSVVSNSSQRTPCSTPGFPVRHRLPDSARVPWASAASHLILYRPLLLTSGSFPVSVLRIRWPKYWSFSFSISPSNEYSGLISFRIEGTLKSLPQYHNLKASILQLSGFFTVQLSNVCDYWKNQSFNSTDLCQQSDVSAFEYAV